MTTHTLTLTAEQNAVAMQLLAESEACPSTTNGIVLGEVCRTDRDPNSATLVLSVIQPKQARCIAKILADQ